MGYTKEQIEAKRDHFGELMLVLESDREYDFHNFTATFGDEVDDDSLRADEVRIEGLREEGGSTEHIVVDIPLDSIEHIYSHREV